MFSPVGINGSFPFVPHQVGMSIQFPDVTQDQHSLPESGVNLGDYRAVYFGDTVPATNGRFTDAWDNLLSNLAEGSQPLEQVPAQISEEQQQHRIVDPAEQDALARTAGKLVEALREERNPKFKNSQFMGLMQSLADRTSVVEGNDIVLATSVPGSTTSTSADVKGKGKERTGILNTFDQTQVHPHSAPIGVISGQQPSSSSYTQGQTSNSTTTSDLTHDYDEVYEYFRQENEDYIAYQQAASSEAVSHTRRIWDESSQSFEWNKLQDEWDAWEVNAVGVRKMSNYQFAAENPYLLGSSTRVHDMHSSFDQVGVSDADHRWH